MNDTPQTADWEKDELPHVVAITTAAIECSKQLGTLRALNVMLNVLFSIEIQMPPEVMERARAAYANKVIAWRKAKEAGTDTPARPQ